MHLTEKAIDKIKEIADAEGIGHYSIRVRLLSGGCAGFSRDIIFDDKPSDLDEILLFRDKVQIIIDPISYQYMIDTSIDYEDHLMSAGFRFSDPNITGSCGCQNSVSY